MLETARAWDQSVVWTKMMNRGDATGTANSSKPYHLSQFDKRFLNGSFPPLCVQASPLCTEYLISQKDFLVLLLDLDSYSCTSGQSIIYTK